METISDSIGVPVWVLVILASAIVSWSVTEVMKQSVVAYRKKHKGERSWWWNTIFRSLPLTVGVLIGFYLERDQGWLLGFIGGAFCTTLVAIIKGHLKKIQAKANEDTP